MELFNKALYRFRTRYPFYSVLTLESRINNLNEDINVTQIKQLRNNLLEICISKSEIDLIIKESEPDCEIDNIMGFLCFQSMLVILKIPSRSKMFSDKFAYFKAASIVIQQMLHVNEKVAHYPKLSDYPDLDSNKKLKYYYDNIVEYDDNSGSSSIDFGDITENWEDINGEKIDKHIDVKIDENREVFDNQSRKGGHSSFNKVIQDVLEQMAPKVNWRKHMRMFVAKSIKSIRYRTHQRQSKRFKGQKGIRRRNKCKIIVAIDTSASVTIQELSLFYSEIIKISKQGVSIDIAEVDTELQRIYQFDGKLPNAVHGRGGTSFEPVFRHLQETTNNYDGLIYFTDGMASVPSNYINIKTLWVLCPETRLEASDMEQMGFFGKILKIDE